MTSFSSSSQQGLNVKLQSNNAAAISSSTLRIQFYFDISSVDYRAAPVSILLKFDCSERHLSSRFITEKQETKKHRNIHSKKPGWVCCHGNRVL